MFNLFVRSRKNSWKNVIDIKRCQKQIRILQFKKSHIQLGPLNNNNNPKDYILVMFMLYSPKKYEVLFQQFRKKSGLYSSSSRNNPDYSVAASGTIVSVLVSVSAPLLFEAVSVESSADPVSVSVSVGVQHHLFTIGFLIFLGLFRTLTQTSFGTSTHSSSGISLIEETNQRYCIYY